VILAAENYSGSPPVAEFWTQIVTEGRRNELAESERIEGEVVTLAAECTGRTYAPPIGSVVTEN
jgi:hypothetical protein